MRCVSLVALVVVLGGGALRASAQEAHSPQPADQARSTHGIIRKPQPKPPADSARSTSATEPGKAEHAKAEPAKAEPPIAGTGKTEAARATERPKTSPSASTQAVAAAIANAVRSLEEKEKKKTEVTRPEPARNTRPAVRPVPRRHYAVNWPSQRFEVQWVAAPDDRIELSWGAQEAD